MKISNIRAPLWLVAPLVAVLGCPSDDDGGSDTNGDSDTETETTSTSGTDSVSTSSTTTTTTGTDSDTTTTDTTTTTDGTTGTDSDTDGTGTDGGTDTGALDCTQYDNEADCNNDGDCEWFGGGAVCVPNNPADNCDQLNEQQCNAIPACTYDAENMVCETAG